MKVCLKMYCFPSICLQVSVFACKTHNSIQKNDITIKFSMIVYRTMFFMVTQLYNYSFKNDGQKKLFIELNSIQENIQHRIIFF